MAAARRWSKEPLDLAWPMLGCGLGFGLRDWAIEFWVIGARDELTGGDLGVDVAVRAVAFDPHIESPEAGVELLFEWLRVGGHVSYGLDLEAMGHGTGLSMLQARAIQKEFAMREGIHDRGLVQDGGWVTGPAEG